MAPVAVHRQAPRTMPVRPGRPAAAGAASHARSPATGSRRPRLPPALGAGCGPVRTGSYSGRRVRARPAAPSGARGRSARPAPPAASATTRRMSSVQPTAPNPWDSAAAGVPAADVAGGAVGELGRSAEVGVGVAVLVRVGRVGAVAATLGSGGCRSVRSWSGSPSRPRRRRATAEPKDQDQDEPGQKPCPTCPTAKDRCSRPPVPVSGRGWDSPRQHPQDIRIDDHLRIGQGRRGNHARQATPAVLWPGSVCGITRSG